MANITGIIHKLYPTEQPSAKFQKREVVLMVPDGSYVQYVKIQFCQDYVDLLHNYKEGQKVSIDYSLKGREWQDKFFTNVDGWKIALVEDSAAAEPIADMPEPIDFAEYSEEPNTSAAPAPAAPAPATPIDDDLPF